MKVRDECNPNPNNNARVTRMQNLGCVNSQRTLHGASFRPKAKPYGLACRSSIACCCWPRAPLALTASGGLSGKKMHILGVVAVGARSVRKGAAG